MLLWLAAMLYDVPARARLSDSQQRSMRERACEHGLFRHARTPNPAGFQVLFWEDEIVVIIMFSLM